LPGEGTTRAAKDSGAAGRRRQRAAKPVEPQGSGKPAKGRGKKGFFERVKDAVIGEPDE
jgi:hypothetical protein